MTTGITPASTAGTIALVGSSEYTDAMNETDRYLLDTVGGAMKARIVLLPTAIGLKPNELTYWNAMGQHHFSALGVRDIRSSLLIDRHSAHDPPQLDLLRDANFFYFSGGNPQQVVTTMHSTPAWDLIIAAHQRGAVLAGCSAGAMALSAYTILAHRSLARFSNDAISFVPALAIASSMAVFPHFDRTMGRLGKHALQTGLITAPENTVLVGIDENTALVRLTPPDGTTGKATWRVMGYQNVTIFWPGQNAKTLKVGDEASL